MEGSRDGSTWGSRNWLCKELKHFLISFLQPSKGRVSIFSPSFFPLSTKLFFYLALRRQRFSLSLKAKGHTLGFASLEPILLFTLLLQILIGNWLLCNPKKKGKREFTENVKVEKIENYLVDCNCMKRIYWILGSLSLVCISFPVIIYTFCLNIHHSFYSPHNFYNFALRKWLTKTKKEYIQASWDIFSGQKNHL